jgi:hypothetical protein
MKNKKYNEKKDKMQEKGAQNLSARKNREQFSKF